MSSDHRRLRETRRVYSNAIVEMAGALLVEHDAPLKTAVALWRLADAIALGFTFDDVLVSVYTKAFTDDIPTQTPLLRNLC